MVCAREELVGATGRKRNTGRVDCDARSTHFQSSLINAPRVAAAGTSSMVLNTLARLIFNRFSEPAATEILRRRAGMKLASVTRTE